LYLTLDEQDGRRFQQEFVQELEAVVVTTPEQVLALCSQQPMPFTAVLNAAEPTSSLGLRLMRVLKDEHHVTQPILWLLQRSIAPALRTVLLDMPGSEIFSATDDQEQLLTRLHFLARAKPMPVDTTSPYALRMPLSKRIMDVVCAGGALLVLSPILLVLAALIKLESRGPVFYYSYRVGAGYRVFKFWKLRSMRSDADQMLDSIKNLNQYQSNGSSTAPESNGSRAYATPARPTARPASSSWWTSVDA
jgi:hypothetical protein